MTTFHGTDALLAATGTHLGYSPWHEITQERIDQFAQATGDHQWIHVDPERAARGPFGTTIAHGFLTVSLLPLLTAEVYAIEGVTMIVNYGLNKVRFPVPVPVGSRVRAGVHLQSADPHTRGFMVESVVTIELGGSDKPVCVAETLTLVVP